jgi:hypothetical protein
LNPPRGEAPLDQQGKQQTGRPGANDVNTHNTTRSESCRLSADKLFAGWSKRTQRRGARRSISGGVLSLYVDAKSVERNEAYEVFSAARQIIFLSPRRAA